MKISKRFMLLAVMIFLAAGCFAAKKSAPDSRFRSISDVTDALGLIDCFRTKARFTVTMPQLSDDVVYNLDLMSLRAVGDPLMPCDYLIDWELVRDEGSSHGFSSYFDGHHYRYSAERLQEYHMEWDSVPFMPQKFGITRGVGVQRAAQFVDLLPQVMAEEITRLASDSLSRVQFHPDTLVSGRRSTVVEIKVIVAGEVSRECEYVFDALTGLPVRVILENSPGSIGEQTVTVHFDETFTDGCEPLDEGRLIDKYPTVFEQFRRSNFRIENMRGARLPGFALPTLTGERFSRRLGDPLRVPTVMVLLEGEGGFNRNVIKDIRAAVALLPVEVQIIWVFTDNNIDVVESQIAAPGPGETILISGRGFARDCGVADLPVVMLVDKESIVRNVILGYNQSLSTDVIQEMSTMAQ